MLSELGAADFERVAPPAEIWAGIEATVTAERAAASRAPKAPPAQGSPSPMVVDYWIDANDVVTEVANGWAAFATDNNAPELTVLDSDRSLWSYFDRDEVRELWQVLVQRLRASQRTAQVPLRCDATDTRRWFEMTITPSSDGSVH
ncbi:MAG: hypothetical protein ACR2QE_18910, partial [Acidimicrobiales bacterium]